MYVIRQYFNGNSWNNLMAFHFSRTHSIWYIAWIYVLVNVCGSIVYCAEINNLELCLNYSVPPATFFLFRILFEISEMFVSSGIIQWLPLDRCFSLHEMSGTQHSLRSNQETRPLLCQDDVKHRERRPAQKFEFFNDRNNLAWLVSQ